MSMCLDAVLCGAVTKEVVVYATLALKPALHCVVMLKPRLNDAGASLNVSVGHAFGVRRRSGDCNADELLLARMGACLMQVLGQVLLGACEHF